jgi:hypothetical protein
MTGINREITGFKRCSHYRCGGGVKMGQNTSKNYPKPLKIKENHQIG